jgi:hypothetical protein
MPAALPRRILGVLVWLVAPAFVFSAVPVVTAQPVGGATTQVQLRHGLNLGGQTGDGQGGTPTTWCSGTTVIFSGLEFAGGAIGPDPVAFGFARPSGEPWPLQVYEGDFPSCAAPEGALLVDETVTPEGAAMAVVLTSNDPQGTPELLVVPIDYSCTAAGTGRGVIVHAANAPEVEVLDTALGASVGTIAHGEQVVVPVSVGTTHRFELRLVGGAAEPVAVLDPVEVAEPGNLIVWYLHGNQPGDPTTPFAVARYLDVTGRPGVCETPAGPEAPAAEPTPAPPTVTG